MKNLFAFLLVVILSLTTYAQELKPVTGVYLQREERGNTHGKESLTDAYSLIEYDGVYYSTHGAGLMFKNYLIYSLDKAYESTSEFQSFHFDSKTSYIAFWDVETSSYDKVIDLDKILVEANVKQIGHDKGKVSIAISKDGKTMFFGTATNTYKYNLLNDSWIEIKPNKAGVYSLSPLNEVLQGNKLVFLPMKSYNNYDWFPRTDQFLEYDYVTKKIEIKP